MPPKSCKKRPSSTGDSSATTVQSSIGFLPPGVRTAGLATGNEKKAPRAGAGGGNGGGGGGSAAATGGKRASAKKGINEDDLAMLPDYEDDFTHHGGDDAFGYRFEEGFCVPKRLAPVPRSLVEAVNDFHFAMMNDTPRNQFYYDLLKSYVTPETGVLEIGAGSGLLSMMAAKLGAKWVVAVEGSPEMSQLARQNIKANNFQGKIKVLNMLSTELTLKDLPERPHVLVSEIFGTMLLGESALDYIADVRKRILRPDTKIIPQLGVQYAVPVECPIMDQVCSVDSWNGLDLSHVLAVKDTVSIVFTKQYGFRMSSVPYKFLSKPVKILDIDFAKTSRDDLPQRFTLPVQATESGKAHAWLFFFEARDFLKPTAEEAANKAIGESAHLIMSTNPKDTIDNFPRDMQWGQALQLIDTDVKDATMPSELTMEAGKSYNFRCNFSYDRVVVQMRCLGEAQAAAAAKNEAEKAHEAATQ